MKWFRRRRSYSLFKMRASHILCLILISRHEKLLAFVVADQSVSLMSAVLLLQGKDWNSQAKVGNGGFYGIAELVYQCCGLSSDMLLKGHLYYIIVMPENMPVQADSDCDCCWLGCAMQDSTTCKVLHQI